MVGNPQYQMVAFVAQNSIISENSSNDCNTTNLMWI